MVVNRSASPPEPRKRYTRTSINSLTDTSQYQVEVSPESAPQQNLQPRLL